MEKEVKIIPPDGYEIDKENSTFECIKFKEIKKCWRKKAARIVNGYYITNESLIHEVNKYHYKEGNDKNLFSKLEDVKSALAAAQISMIIDNDKRFGGRITDEEWSNDKAKFNIIRTGGALKPSCTYGIYCFLTFHTLEQRDLFLEENEDLIKDYYHIKDEKVDITITQLSNI